MREVRGRTVTTDGGPAPLQLADSVSARAVTGFDSPLALDQFDRLMADLLRRGERKQDKHIRVNAKKLNAHLGILTRAMEAVDG